MSPTTMTEWAAKHGVSDWAMQELRMMCFAWGTPELVRDEGKSERHVQSRARLEASQRDDLFVMRNNVGALKDDSGRTVRYGLANDSSKMNDLIKSSDLIAIHKRLIMPADVGTYIGQFVAAEIKPEGWTYTGQGREVAQMNFAKTVYAFGGKARFYAGGEYPCFGNLPQY